MSRAPRPSARAWLLALCVLLAGSAASVAQVSAEPTRTQDLSGDGWRVWRDPIPTWPDEQPLPPGVALQELPVRAPSAGWDALARGQPAQVPTSLEALFGPEEPDPRGVSWWSRAFELPAGVLQHPERWSLSLRFHSVGRRAEVFVNRQLVGRDDVGLSAFEVPLELPDLLRPQNQLDVRVTDPGGNFGWRDEHAHTWGDAKIPAAHGFGGLLGGVELLVRPQRHVADLWVQSGAPGEPALLHLELDTGRAPGAPPRRGVAPRRASFPELRRAEPGLSERASLRVKVEDPAARGAQALFQTQTFVALPAAGGRGRLRLALELPDAPRWSPEAPHLLRVHVEFEQHRVSHVFGLRQLRLVGLGDDARLELDGRRRMLRSAISWGYWPITGGVPSPALARRQVESARALGLDMLNHHRNHVHPSLLPWHDRLGLFAHLEPGGYASVGGGELSAALARERWLRLLVLARRHPSVIVANMINEASEAPGERARRDLADGQLLAPDLLLTYTSAWAETDAPEWGLHARPGEAGLHTNGWFDQHHAPGPGVWRDEFWRGPEEHLLRTSDRANVVFFGEDGAIGSPPQLASLVAEWQGQPLGWDGADYAARLAAWRSDFRARGWPHDDATLDALFASFGDVVYDYHARVIENLRLDGVADGYVINGWDDQKIENHSGLVDARRRPKGDPAILARASAPSLLAIKAHASVLQVRPVHDGARLPTELRLDLGWVDELGVEGAHELQLEVLDQGGRRLLDERHEVQLVGNGAPQELLRDHVLALAAEPGWLRLTARLVQAGGAEPVVRARTHEWLLAVDGRHRPVPPGGALLDDARGRLAQHFREQRKQPLPRFSVNGPARDWVLVADLDPEPSELVPAAVFRRSTAPEAAAGLQRELFTGADFEHRVQRSFPDSIDVIFDPEAPPAGLDAPYTLRWRGAIVPPESGRYRFSALTAGGVRLRLDGEPVFARWPDERPDEVHGRLVRLEAGVPVALELEYQQLHEASRVQLMWTRPSHGEVLREIAQNLLRRVHEHGTTLIVLNHTDDWARTLERLGVLRDVRRLKMERYWLGGGFFARPHALLAGLPANGALGRAWQELVHYGTPLYGLRARGLQRVIGTTSDHQLELGTALGWVSHGRGRVLLSTLDLLPTLERGPGAADLPRHLLQNMLEWAAKAR
ncbi:MAG: beta-galactosidase [Planctomycetota bacterium]|nr:MAG: beta-galactosidase [Planctomycetota bacterium]